MCHTLLLLVVRLPRPMPELLSTPNEHPGTLKQPACDVISDTAALDVSTADMHVGQLSEQRQRSDIAMARSRTGDCRARMPEYR